MPWSRRRPIACCRCACTSEVREPVSSPRPRCLEKVVDEPAHLAELVLDQDLRILVGQRSSLRHIQNSCRGTECSQGASELEKNHRYAGLTRLPGRGRCVARDEARMSELLLVTIGFRTVWHRIPSRLAG
jgi:hypothetical protein